jgi:hypothetical protein
VVVDPTLTATEVDHYKDFWVSDLSSQALVTAYDPASHSLFLDRPLSLAAGSSYQLYADLGAGTWSYDFATGTYEKLEQRHWGYTGPLPTGSRLSPGFASNGSYAVLFGGVGNFNFTYGYYDNSTWKLDFATQSYSLLIQMGATGPAARAQIENQLVYDPLRDRFVLFGGRCRDPDRCGAAGARLNDTWLYDPQANAWTDLPPPVSPPPGTRPRCTSTTASAPWCSTAGLMPPVRPSTICGCWTWAPRPGPRSCPPAPPCL